MSILLRFHAEPVAFVHGKAALRRALRAAAAEVRGTAVAMIRRSPGVGRKYYGRFKGLRASAANTAPRNLDNRLIRSIKVRVFRSGEGAAIRADAPDAKGMPYALALEAGAARYRGGRGSTGHRRRSGAPALGYRSAPRPFLSTALEQRGPSLRPRLEAALRQDIRLVRVKP